MAHDDDDGDDARRSIGDRDLEVMETTTGLAIRSNAWIYEVCTVCCWVEAKRPIDSPAAAVEMRFRCRVGRWRVCVA